MKALKTDTKLVTIHTNGNIPELGNISGPISNPQYIFVDLLKKMILRGVVVKEHNPSKITDEPIMLTLQNVRLFNFIQVEEKVTVTHQPTIQKEKNTKKETVEIVEEAVEEKVVEEPVTSDFKQK